MKALRLLAPAILLLTLPLCAGAATITVTSLSTILTEMAQQVGGDHVKVVPLVNWNGPAGIELTSVMRTSGVWLVWPVPPEMSASYPAAVRPF